MFRLAELKRLIIQRVVMHPPGPQCLPPTSLWTWFVFSQFAGIVFCWSWLWGSLHLLSFCFFELIHDLQRREGYSLFPWFFSISLFLIIWEDVTIFSLLYHPLHCGPYLHPPLKCPLGSFSFKVACHVVVVVQHSLKRTKKLIPLTGCLSHSIEIASYDYGWPA